MQKEKETGHIKELKLKMNSFLKLHFDKTTDIDNLNKMISLTCPR